MQSCFCSIAIAIPLRGMSIASPPSRVSKNSTARTPLPPCTVILAPPFKAGNRRRRAVSGAALDWKREARPENANRRQRREPSKDPIQLPLHRPYRTSNRDQSSNAKTSVGRSTRRVSRTFPGWVRRGDDYLVVPPTATAAAGLPSAVRC